ncbi:MAG: hypothetical protein NTY19_43355 [Planctomycetota bacterium]|nr:hypothetical protein [Planctomycetota bacterium]
MNQPLLLRCAVLLLVLGHQTAGAAPSGKKFIELGWDIPTTADLRQHWQDLEQTTPFDGIMFRVEALDEHSNRVSSESVWDANSWKRDWLKPAVEDLQACKFQRFNDNFVRFNATPGNLAWDNDTGWAALAEKAGHCAWLMKQGGGRGLAIDFESYGAAQFRFDPATGSTFVEATKLARLRGAQFVQAIAQEFPDAVLLALWLNSINSKAGRNTQPESILISSAYGLLPAFIDGMLDALPPGMILVDGCENGYTMDSTEAYLQAAHEMRSWHGASLGLVSPENRAKYRQQVQAGFGFYLDMYLNAEGNHYYFPPLNGSRLARLQRNLGLAREAADEYVWIYGEQCRWWGPRRELPNTVGQGRLWEEALPGITRAIAYTHDPLAAAKAELAELRKSGRLTNLAKNADFRRPASPQAGTLPAEFGAWQDEKTSTGKFAWDAEVGDGSGRVTKVKWGCLIQSVAVQPGEDYAVDVTCRSRGRSQPTLVIRWQTAEERWTQEHLDQTFPFESGDGQWQPAFGVVTVPQDVGRLVVLLNVTGQITDDDACWFDNLGVYRLRP